MASALGQAWEREKVLAVGCHLWVVGREQGQAQEQEWEQGRVSGQRRE